MARFVTGNTFGTTDTVTAAKLNTAVNDAAISTDSVDNNTIELNSNALRLKDSSSKTTGVTFAKMQHISTAKVLGRASASEGDVEEAFDFKDEDDMSSNSATALSSQQSIKAFAGMTPAQNGSGGGYSSEESVTFPNGLIMKFGSVSASGSSNTDITFGSAFPSATVSAQITEVKDNATATGNVYIRTLSNSVLKIRNNASGTRDINWLVFGR